MNLLLNKIKLIKTTKINTVVLNCVTWGIQPRAVEWWTLTYTIHRRMR